MFRRGVLPPSSGWRNFFQLDAFSKAPQAIANYPKSPKSPKIKAWSSGLRVGHEADNIIMETMIILRSTKSEVMVKLIEQDYQRMRRRRRSTRRRRKRRKERWWSDPASTWTLFDRPEVGGDTSFRKYGTTLLFYTLQQSRTTSFAWHPKLNPGKLIQCKVNCVWTMCTYF